MVNSEGDCALETAFCLKAKRARVLEIGQRKGTPFAKMSLFVIEEKALAVLAEMGAKRVCYSSFLTECADWLFDKINK